MTRQLTPLSNLAAHRRELDEDDVAERFLGVISDTDRADVRVGVESHPLVVGRVPRRRGEADRRDLGERLGSRSEETGGSGGGAQDGSESAGEHVCRGGWVGFCLVDNLEGE